MDVIIGVDPHRASHTTVVLGDGEVELPRPQVRSGGFTGVRHVRPGSAARVHGECAGRHWLRRDAGGDPHPRRAPKAAVAARGRSPARQVPGWIRRRMGDDETFVAAHTRGGEAQAVALRLHLSSFSALAYTIGSARPQRE